MNNKLLQQTVSILVVLVLCFVISKFTGYETFDPVKITQRIIGLYLQENISSDSIITFRRVFVGLTLGIKIALVSSLVFTFNEATRNFGQIWYDLFKNISPSAWVPLSIIWFGLGDNSIFFLVFITTLFPMFQILLFNSLELLKVYSKSKVLFDLSLPNYIQKVHLPAMLPAILESSKVGFSLAWMGAIVSELVGGQSGLGYELQISRILLQTERIIALMIIVGVYGFVTNRIIGQIQNKKLSWYYQI